MYGSPIATERLQRIAEAEKSGLFAVPQGRDFTVIGNTPYKDGEIIIRFAKKANGQAYSTAEKNQILTSLGGGSMKDEFDAVPDLGTVKLPAGMTVQESLAKFNNKQGILYAQPNYEVKALGTIPNDTYFNYLWGMTAIDAPGAWDVTTGSKEIIVASIDTGVYYTHEDLAANMWVNPREIPGNGIDDDDNGYVDDIYGYDFCTLDDGITDPDPIDDHGHGTHTSGTIGAVGNNNRGVAGVCWNVRIMALKFIAESGFGFTADAIKCIQYSILMGANLSNNSWGGGNYDQGLKDAINAAGAAGMLFIAAAGNNSNDNDGLYPYYPSSFDCESIIAVSATNSNDSNAWFSNYGLKSVDLGAPGEWIFSCYVYADFWSGYTYESGTSMASPHVAGACALVWSLNPFLTNIEVKNTILGTVDPLPALSGLCVSGGRLNVSKAVRKAPFPGSGEPNDPYLISTASQLRYVGADKRNLNGSFWSKSFKLVADIDMGVYTGTSYNPIGNDLNAFTGSFDGNGHIIWGLSYTSTGRDYVGLFGNIGEGGKVKNVKLANVEIDAADGYYTGGLAGASDGIIENCYVSGSINGDSYVGGLAGYNGNSVTNCSADVHVSGVDSIGGLVGANGSDAIIADSFTNCSVDGDTFVGGLVGGNYGTIRNCFAASLVWGISGAGGLTGDNYHGTITKSYTTGYTEGTILVGGLVGFNDSSRITDCYARGFVSGNSKVGGLVGENHSGSPSCSPCSLITGCYSAGYVSGTTDTGGLVGKSVFGIVGPDCFWDVNESGVSSSAGGMGKTTAEMKTQSTFTDAGWDFTDTWKIQNGVTYPYFKRQGFDGSGAANDPYRIYTAAEMNSIGTDSNNLDKHFQLVDNIDLRGYTGTTFHIIGDKAKAFTGSFDGNNLTISNFTYRTTEDVNYVGLFGHIGKGGEVKNLKFLSLSSGYIEVAGGSYIGELAGWNEGTVTNVSVVTDTNYYYLWTNSANEVGGLVGWNDGSITNCSAVINIYGDSYLGGLVGVNGGGTITHCQASGDVWGGSELGGLVGWNGGTITESSASGSVREGSSYLGGLVGYGSVDTVTNCYATGDVNGTSSKVGGLVGRSYRGIITNCYSAGAVSGTSDTGGLVGKNYNAANVIASFWDVMTSGQAASAGGEGKTPIQMRTKSTFTDAGWDFVNIWKIRELATYPYLNWQYSSGSGTEADPYKIYTPEDMNSIGTYIDNLDKHFKLADDINLVDYNDTKFDIIGGGYLSFIGSFDGGNYTISNFTVKTSPNYGEIGLFGRLGAGGEIKNLHLNNIKVETPGGVFIGGLVGWNRGGRITNVSVSGSISGGMCDIGGLVGYNGEGVIDRCQADCNISGESALGGLVGKNFLGGITESSASGSVTGSSYLGGLVGEGTIGTVTACYATGAVTGTSSKVGGLVGESYYETITNCYSAGAVSGTGDTGGLVGKNDNAANVTASFWDTQTSGQAASAGGTGKTTAQMKTRSTFTGAGWDFTSIWSINESVDYPRLIGAPHLLTTMAIDGDLAPPTGVDFYDFAFLANRWLETDCASKGDCGGADIDKSGTVDAVDLKYIRDHWLEGTGL